MEQGFIKIVFKNGEGGNRTPAARASVVCSPTELHPRKISSAKRLLNVIAQRQNSLMLHAEGLNIVDIRIFT